ncbi:hypothetical protein [Euzebyella saccharophila]|uniref:Uncharacterized protein n=1 Tax=Euzebyella saccharophila TaxID=679664 RepID=A0ABV8JRR8_9FLAO|nr:hypothetical protein [Euzebyella saccharophila]
MKKPFFTLLSLCLLFFVQFGTAQNKYEREYRIKKSQFPEKALELISTKLENAKRVRFYKETDSTKVSYEAKFKKDRLHYSVEFDEDGVLEDVEILIKSIDIPNDSYSLMTKYLEKKFKRYRIRRMQQQYPVGADPIETTLRNAFQNLMLPTIKYELIVSGKGDSGYEQFEILFNANGGFEKIRKSLPPNYDHVLY